MKKILVADDEAAIHELHADELSIAGYEVITASDGSGLIEMFQQGWGVGRWPAKEADLEVAKGLECFTFVSSYWTGPETQPADWLRREKQYGGCSHRHPGFEVPPAGSKDSCSGSRYEAR